MKPKPRGERRKTKLPPLLDIDEDGVPVADFEPLRPSGWSSDEEAPGVQLEDWPAELDD
ncbi:MAG TPA: hypothetical protein VEG27_05965 [Usitatibacter sp.]|nr:hypothetical protein [Usitatibacter sp.]